MSRAYNKETIGVVFVLVFVCLIVLGLIILVTRMIFSENQQYGKECCAQRFSALCNDLSIHPDDDYLTFEIHRNMWSFSVNEQREYVCTTDNLPYIVDKYAEKTATLRIAKGLTVPQYLSCGNRNLARRSGDMTAYFNKISPDQNFKEDAIQLSVYWDKHSAHSFTDSRLLYKNGEITVPETRIYSLYASVIFGVNQMQRSKQRVSLRICRRVHNYEGTLFGTTKQITAGIRNIYTSLRVGGELLLNKGDIILVRVSSARNLYRNSVGNTFAMFPMS